MAIFLCYGNFNGKYGDKFSYDILYELLEQNVESNYSKVRFYGYIRSWGYTASGSTSSCYINGQQIATFTSISKDQYKEMGYLDVIVNHNSDGTGSVVVTGLCDTPWTLGDASCSGTLALPTIPRSSSISCTDGYIESAVAININRATDSFTHNLRYSFGSLSGAIANGVTVSYGWTIPSDFYSQIPNSQSGQCTIYCDTYNNGTLIGTSSTIFTVRTDETKCKPTLTATIEDTNSEAIALTGDKNKLIKFISNPKITINATAKNSSTISNRSVSCADGKNGSGTTVTLNKVESGNFTVSATDSRGYTTTISITKELIDYVILTLNPIFERTGPTTDKIRLDVNGNYYANSFGSTNNTLNLKYRYKELNGTYSSYKTVTATINNQDNKYSLSMELTESFDYQKQYEFEIIVTDKLNSVPQNISVSKGIPIRGTFEKFLEHWGFKTIENVNDKTRLNVDLIYPVGSIYMSVNSTNPSNIFGGTWTQLKNAYLFATNATSGTKGTGSGSGNITGAANGNTGSTVLSIDQIPSHTHISKHLNSTAGSMNGWIGQMGTLSTEVTGASGGNQGHTHTLNGHTHSIPYLEIYVWKRTD